MHRDVKPQNVLLNGDGRAKVTDFGIARSLDVDSVTLTGTVLGTSDYIAPEQASGQPVDTQTDVYSLGVVLYELLAGDVPFRGDNFVAVAMNYDPPMYVANFEYRLRGPFFSSLQTIFFADAGRVLDRRDLVAAAEANARFLLSHMLHGGRMRRSYKDGRAPLAGYLEDQAAVADGLLALYEATFDPRWLDALRALINEMLTAFWDETRRAFFDSAADQERLVARPQDVTDNAIPSGTSLAVDVLLRAGMLLGEPSWIDRGQATLERLAPTAAKAPLAFGRLIAALDFHLGRTVELAVVGEPADPQTRRLLKVVNERFLPNRLVAVAPGNDNVGTTS